MTNKATSTLIPFWTGQLAAAVSILKDLCIKSEFTPEQKDMFQMQLLQARCHVAALEKFLNES